MAKLPDTPGAKLSDLPPLKLALLARKLQPKLAAAMSEPVAIVGAGCRFPGGVDSTASLWSLLAEGREAITDIPASRWHAGSWYAPEPGTPGKMYTRRGGFIDGAEEFDPQFFGIAPREARGMDPNQRLMLEVAWEALEHAGIPPRSLKRSPTGAFLGMMNEDFSLLLPDPSQIGSHTASGSKINVAVGRLSYMLGLNGPAIAVDTACSSSLVSTHMACQALRSRQCDLALAAGVNLILSPLTSVVACANGMLSRSERCHTFDASADGFVRSEGCAVLVLKRLSDAVSDGDRILALIRGTAVNHSGRTSGLTVPGGNALTQVVRAALRDGCVDAGQVGYVEAHGTGTSIGDPIELESLGRVFGAKRSADDPLLVGSIKTNLGHTEGAAGIAGILKVALAFQREQIPPHLHLETPNPNVRWGALPIQVTTDATPWPRGERRRLAGVTAFGFSGTNAHVVMEEAPRIARPTTPPRPHQLLALSARTRPALAAMAAQYAALLSDGDAPLADVCYSAAVGRTDFEHRLALVATDRDGARAALARFAAGEPPDDAHSGTARRPLRVAFVFEDAGGPAAFAERRAQCERWQALGVTPAAILGRGDGALAAACAAGAMTWERGEALATSGRDPEAALAAEPLQQPRVPLAIRGEPAADTLRTHAVGAILRMGPEGPLASAAATALSQIAGGSAPRWVDPAPDDRRARLEILAGAWAGGLELDWSGVWRGARRSKVALPTYPFQRARYWIEPPPPTVEEPEVDLTALDLAALVDDPELLAGLSDEQAMALLDGLSADDL